MPLGIFRFPDTWRPHHDTAVAWHFQCSDAFSREDLLLDKGKPAARQGRKVTGQASSLTAGLPKKDVRSPPGAWWVSPQRRPRCLGRTLGLPSRAWGSAFSCAGFFWCQRRVPPGSWTPPGPPPRRISTAARSWTWRPIGSTTAPRVLLAQG